MTIEESSTPRVHEEAKAVSSTHHRDSTDFALESIGAAASTPRVHGKAKVVSPTNRRDCTLPVDLALEPIGASSTPRVPGKAKVATPTHRRDSPRPLGFALESIGAAASTPRVPEKANVVSPTHRKGPIFIELEPIGASSTPRDHEKSTLVACGRALYLYTHIIYAYHIHISLEGDGHPSDMVSMCACDAGVAYHSVVKCAAGKHMWKYARCQKKTLNLHPRDQ